MKPYDIGLIVGRFQHFHRGHESLVETALILCDRLLILVGSAQESGTRRNPFGISTRINLIREIYNQPNVIIKALPNLSHEDDITSDWGRYVLKHVDDYFYKIPELMIYGNDESRSRWFDLEDIKDTLEVIVPRSKLPISATILRELLVNNQRREWMKWVHPRLHKFYDEIRTELLTTMYYQDIYQKILIKENNYKKE